MSAFQHPETMEKMKSPMDIVWQWQYEIDIDKLRRLYTMAKQEQWNSDTEINWDREIDPSADVLDPERMPIKTTKFWKTLSKSQQESFSAHNASYMLSQFLHGEQGALMVAAALVHAVPDYEAKLYAATQAMDEARHVEVFERYIKKLDKIYPIEHFLKSVLDRTLTQEHWVGMLAGMQMIVEGLALGSFVNMHQATTEPLFKDMLGYVIKDEARHVAYGNVYVKETVSTMHKDDLAPVEDFAFDAVIAMRTARYGGGGANGRVYDQVMKDCGIDPKDFQMNMMKEYMEGWRPQALPGQVHTFKDLMMPQLVRAGLVSSDRIRKKYEQAQVKMFEDVSILKQIEVSLDMDLSN